MDLTPPMSICVGRRKLVLEQRVAQPSGIWASAGVPLPLPPLLTAFPGFWFFCGPGIHPRKDNIKSPVSAKRCVGGKESEKMNACPEESHFPACCCNRHSSRGGRKRTEAPPARGYQHRRRIRHFIMNSFPPLSICHIHFFASIRLWRCPHLTPHHHVWLRALSIFGTIHQHRALNYCNYIPVTSGENWSVSMLNF